jgi:AraC-like DNA-binding protein
LGATLSRLATSLYEESGVLTVEEGAAAVEAYLGILSGCIGSSDSARQGVGRREELWARIQRAIESRLGDPNLSPGDIAASLGVSTRHLHRLFSGADLTVGEWIRCRRLQRCRADLASPRLRDRTITEIALFWGFSDSSHFSRCFKSEFGLSARAFRKRVVNDPESGRLRAQVSNVLVSGGGGH